MVTQKYVGDVVKISLNLTNICPESCEYFIQFGLQAPSGFYWGIWPTFNKTLTPNQVLPLDFIFDTSSTSVNWELGVWKFRVIAENLKTGQKVGLSEDVYAYVDIFELITPPPPTPAYTLGSYFRTLTSPAEISSAKVGDRIRYSAIAKKDGTPMNYQKIRFYTQKYPFTSDFVWYITTDTRSDGWADGDYTITQEDANAGSKLRFLSIWVDRDTYAELARSTADMTIV